MKCSYFGYVWRALLWEHFIMSCGSSDNLLWPGLSTRLLVECFSVFSLGFKTQPIRSSFVWPGGLCPYWLHPLCQNISQPLTLCRFWPMCSPCLQQISRYSCCHSRLCSWLFTPLFLGWAVSPAWDRLCRSTETAWSYTLFLWKNRRE